MEQRKSVEICKKGMKSGIAP